MILQELVSTEELRELTAQEVLDELSVDIDLDRDNTAYTWSGLYDKLALMGFSESQLDSIEDGIAAFHGGKVLVNSLGSGGLSFGRDDIQLKLLTLLDSGSLTEEQSALVYALKSIGQPVGKRWQKEGLSSLPTLSEIGDAITLRDKEDALTIIQNRVNAAYEAAAEEFRAENGTPSSIVQAAESSWTS